jgi:aminopeptidase C
MLIFGKAKDQNGREYYMVKNSWGTKSNDFEGIWYMSRTYMALNTTYIFLNRNACPAATFRGK